MKTLYFMIGAPGIGKSTFLKKASKKIFAKAGNKKKLLEYVVSPDNLRAMIESPKAKPDGTFGISQENEKYVWSIINDILEKKTSKGELIIVDATHSRNKAISAYKKYSDMGYRIVGINLSPTATIEEVLKRNAERVGKMVPEDVVRTMHQRCLDLDIPGWVEVISPDDFVRHFNDIKYDYNNYESIRFFGDIHGCPEELQKMFELTEITVNKDKTANVFIGDYFDRGYGIIETFKMLQTFAKENETVFLKGNHEEPLAYYKEFMKEISEDIHEWIDDVKEGFIKRGKLLERSKSLKEIIKDQNHKYRYLDNFGWILPKRVRYYENDLAVVQQELKGYFYQDIPQEAFRLLKTFRGSSYKQLDALIEDLKIYPETFEKLEAVINEFRLPDHLEKNREYGFFMIKRSAVYTMKKFLLSDITYQEISLFQKRLQQMFYVDFHGTEVVATHGGLAELPTRATPASDMIRGVGGYDDALECDETFNRLTDAIGIHGHRNMTNLPLRTTDKTYNINGDVDLGLRGVTLHQDQTSEGTEIGAGEVAKSHFKRFQLKRAKKFNARKLSLDEQGEGLISMFQNHTHVNVKKLPNNVAAINFTRKAFEKGIWDEVTVKARGLFVGMDTLEDKASPDEISIIARGYEKFFNLGERHGLDTKDIRELAFPIRAYEKANGYLGIMSVDNRDPSNPKWFTASKSTSEGDFADNFRRMVHKIQSLGLMKRMIEDKTTLIFEVVDPIFDPHIQEYKEEELILLDAIKNELNFGRVSYEMLDEYLDLMPEDAVLKGQVRKKRLEKMCTNFNDWYSLVKEANAVDLLSNAGHEGYVFEDSSENPNMFKLKTDWYSFWKYMRSMKDRIANRIRNNRKNPRITEEGLSKGQLIDLKKGLHREEDMLVWNFMKDIAEEDFSAYEKMSIVDIRNAFLKTREG